MQIASLMGQPQKWLQLVHEIANCMMQWGREAKGVPCALRSQIPYNIFSVHEHLLQWNLKGHCFPRGRGTQDFPAAASPEPPQASQTQATSRRHPWRDYSLFIWLHAQYLSTVMQNPWVELDEQLLQRVSTASFGLIIHLGYRVQKHSTVGVATLRTYSFTAELPLLEA